jgi:hypothetical protein
MNLHEFSVSLDYISLCASIWDYELMRLARYVDRAEVNLRPYSEDGLRLVRGLTDKDRHVASMRKKKRTKRLR